MATPPKKRVDREYLERQQRPDGRRRGSKAAGAAVGVGEERAAAMMRKDAAALATSHKDPGRYADQLAVLSKARAKRVDSEWLELFEMARDLQRANAVDQVVRTCELAPEMLGLLVDCARGVGSFEGTGAAVRRLAILDVLALSTGAGAAKQDLLPKQDARDIGGKRSLSELEEFIDAGYRRLKELDLRRSAIDAVVVSVDRDQQQANSSENSSEQSPGNSSEQLEQ